MKNMILRKIGTLAIGLILSLSSIGCGAKKYVVHPGSVDEFDSRTYDVLITARGAIQEAKLQFQAGELPEEAKNVINRAVQSYTIVRNARTAYRDWKLTEGGEDEAARLRAQIEGAIPNLQALLSDIALLF